mmetsp:Transcript_16541/g.27344  ORF Transcript_16541/g.27344 Transcript_16541/m.27344 type:complete len:252 (+) Transcript_16541:131-886(+)
MSLKQPVGQKRLTNVSVVRYKKFGKRFEIACYKNKVLEWRNKIEKDLDEVLQVRSVFENVSKGQLAKKEDLQKVFATVDQEKIILVILEQGELQVSEKERDQQFDNAFHEIATIVSQKCVSPDTQRPIPVSVIEKAMKECHYAVVPGRTAKQQALEVIKQLKEKMPIDRAQMRLSVWCLAPVSATLKAKLQPHIRTFINEDKSGDKYTMWIQIDPGSFRVVDQTVREETKGSGGLEVLSLAVHQEGDEHFD